MSHIKQTAHCISRVDRKPTMPVDAPMHDKAARVLRGRRTPHYRVSEPVVLFA
ncbi:MAG TPA: hypothetical protein VL598_12825 [Trinickia sp.]|jgi:hypothetical protein|uniref:hypothetical protein n=1 Tax=Trinickia sp. TaxID=2571163 RepID=UPI002CFF11D5|nr:hypothetical protein [Trinickia sp.]HTI18542.1 hypothetical protein [Trinickia sp.]